MVLLNILEMFMILCLSAAIGTLVLLMVTQEKLVFERRSTLVNMKTEQYKKEDQYINGLQERNCW
ncbi:MULTISPECIES: hypothetical protein [unclassified Granulicatella]|uniref:hypothetical protein n=1 Tax=unclassified Granulicatella TaxID=2630493 RepID=UPI001073FA26|nr:MULTISPECIES: hypothetical protein [unclassified Granulicatella]MBF0780012.1 hypothetical protein [Granulicatella sp. 19428wC4_WM01]TFU95938.1 hypothetical protein E4T68_02785 [Granulicatella sp. WM01]